LAISAQVAPFLAQTMSIAAAILEPARRPSGRSSAAGFLAALALGSALAFLALVGGRPFASRAAAVLRAALAALAALVDSW
jgi:hypothetical protein